VRQRRGGSGWFGGIRSLGFAKELLESRLFLTRGLFELGGEDGPTRLSSRLILVERLVGADEVARGVRELQGVMRGRRGKKDARNVEFECLFLDKERRALRAVRRRKRGDGHGARL
jgi:hypothetical protein